MLKPLLTSSGDSPGEAPDGGAFKRGAWARRKGGTDQPIGGIRIADTQPCMRCKAARASTQQARRSGVDFVGRAC